LLHKEFWYVIVFHNCPYNSIILQEKIDSIINNLFVAVTPCSKPSSLAIKLFFDYLQRRSSNGNKPSESFFNWNNIRGISAQIAYRTYQRTIFKKYGSNKHSLYTSLD
jgi:hypothetical protein